MSPQRPKRMLIKPIRKFPNKHIKNGSISPVSRQASNVLPFPPLRFVPRPLRCQHKAVGRRRNSKLNDSTSTVSPIQSLGYPHFLQWDPIVVINVLTGVRLGASKPPSRPAQIRCCSSLSAVHPSPIVVGLSFGPLVSIAFVCSPWSEGPDAPVSYP